MSRRSSTAAIFSAVIAAAARQVFGQQAVVSQIAAMPYIPVNYQYENWTAVAQGFDSTVFNPVAQSGYEYPSFWFQADPENGISQGFGMPSYIGQTQSTEGNGEAITQIGAVLGASLVGIDKQSQTLSNGNTYDFVQMASRFYDSDTGADLVLNNIDSQGTGQFWYDQLPQIMFDGLISQYYSSYAPGSAGQQRLDTIMTTGAAEMHTMIDVLAGNSTTATPNFNYAGFNYVTQTPIVDSSETQPDGAGGAAYEQYVAYIHTGNATDLSDAERCMNALQNTPANDNPLYETILPFGALTAARLNAEQGTDYDVAKIVNWCFSPTSVVRSGWGAISASEWGGYGVSGLIGSTTDDGGYGFSMNSYIYPMALVPLVRYDDRFANSIGQWMLNLTNSARLFLKSGLPASNQTNASWNDAPSNYYSYEGVKETYDGVSPQAGGDGTGYNSSWLNFAYGSGDVGVLGSIVSPTNVSMILQLNLLATDFFHEAADPSYLLYNPYNTMKTVQINVGSTPVNVYDAISDQFLATDVSGLTSINIPGESSRSIVYTPVGGALVDNGTNVSVDGVIVNYRSPELNRLYWDPDGSAGGSVLTGTWDSTTANWNPSSAGTSATNAWNGGEVAMFAVGTSGSGTYTVTVSGTQSIGGLNFQTGSVTLQGGSFSLASDSTVTAASGVQTINTPISGSFALLKDGPGTVVLGAVNTYTGLTTIENGVLQLGNAFALENTNVDVDVNNGLNLNSMSALIGGLSGSGNVNIGSQNLIVGNDNEPAVYAGQISGSGEVVKNGTGSWTLGGPSNYSGGTNLNNGVLIVSNASGSATGSGNVTLNGGTLASGPVSSISGNVIAGTGAHTIAPGGVGSIGSLTIGGLTTSNQTTLNFDLGTGSGVITNGDLLVLGNGTVSIASGTAITFGVDPTAGGVDYRLIGDTSGGAVVDGITLANFTLPAAPSGITYSLSDSVDPGFIDLMVGGPGPAQNLTWNNAGGTGNGTTWDFNNQNWNNGTAAAIYTDGSNVTFNDNNAGHYNVTLNTTVAPASVTVNTNSSYTISGTGSIGGTGSLTMSGTGTLTLTTANSYSGGTALDGGELSISSGASLGTGPVNFAAPSTLNFTGSAATTMANPVTVTASSTLNLGGAGAVTFAGPFAINSGLVQTGGGTLQITTQPSGSGSITLQAGTLEANMNSGWSIGGTTGAGGIYIGDASNNSSDNQTVLLGSGVTMNYGRLYFQPYALSGTKTLGAMSASGVATINTYIQLESGSINLQLTAPPGGLFDLPLGILGSTTAGITIVGGGTVNLGGIGAAQSEYYEGTTIVQNGTLLLTGNDIVGNARDTYVLGNSSYSQAVQVGDAATPASAQLSLLTDGAVTINHNISINNFGGSIFVGGTGAYSSTFNSAISLAKNVSLTSAAGGAVHFNGNISGVGGITVSGAGTVNLSGANTYAGTTNVSSGSTANISLAGALPSGSTIVNNGSLDINGNSVAGSISGTGSLSIGASSAASLKLAVGSGANFQDALSIAAGSSLDITNNQLFINYGSGADPISSIEQWIANGYYGLSGPSIISSVIATDDALSGLSYGIGYADSADPGNPANLPSGTIEIMFTLLGDANLDGTVNAEDYTPFSHNIGQSGMMWDDEDFNYDGTVNAEDYTLLSHNIGQSAVLAASASDLEPPDAISLANVPEPISAGMMVMAGVGVLLRRRRPTIPLSFRGS
jgi:autotransporter-associated beta strand protein